MTDVITPTPTLLERFENFLAENALAIQHTADGSPIGVYTSPNHYTPLETQIRGVSDAVLFASWWETYKQWLIGDIYRLGFRLVGEMFAQVGNSPSLKTIQNWASIVQHYSFEERALVGKLDWSFFYELATMESKRERAALLARCHAEDLTIDELRAIRNQGKPDQIFIVRGMQRYNLGDALGTFINDEEYSRAKNDGKMVARVSFVVTFE